MNFNLGWDNFQQEVSQKDEDIDLLKAALFLAQAEYVDLELSIYINLLDRIAESIAKTLPETRYPLKVIKAINKYLFEELGFYGNTEDYYNPKNSYINEVLDRGTGIPISLSVVYLEIAKRIDFPMVGIGMPGHFLIGLKFEDVGFFIDVFNNGEIIFDRDCEDRLSQIYQQPMKLEARFIEPVTNRQILARMLTNLKYIYINIRELNKALRIADGIVMLYPDNPREIRDRGLLYYQLSEWQQAISDLNFYLKMCPYAEDSDKIRSLLDKIV
jgi:regulator of sirC expression with transglutaminase-like and TPR domain